MGRPSCAEPEKITRERVGKRDFDQGRAAGRGLEQGRPA
jgi:hypothetical protein